MSRIRGGRKRDLSKLQLRRKAYDALPQAVKDTYTRPGSTNQHKQA